VAATSGATADGEAKLDTEIDGAVPRPRVPRFRVTTECSGGRLAWLSLSGQLDLRSAGFLARELLSVEGRVRQVVLDARGLSFLDAVGLHILLHASQRAKRGGWDLAVIRGGRALDRLFRLPSVGRHLRLVDHPTELLS
jgi:anti-anti-sigma factor